MTRSEIVGRAQKNERMEEKNLDSAKINEVSKKDQIIPKGRLDAVVKLNIGGVKFQTTKSTLLKSGDNYFSTLLNSSFGITTDQEGTRTLATNNRLVIY